MCRCLFQSEKSYTRMYTNCNWPLFEEKPYCTQTPTDHCLKKSHMRMYTNSSWPLITSEVCKLTSKNDQRRRKNYKSRSAEIFISLPYVHLSMMKLVMLNILWGSSHYSFSLRVSPLSPPPPIMLENCSAVIDRFQSIMLFSVSVGKTSLITRFMYDSFDNTYQVMFVVHCKGYYYYCVFIFTFLATSLAW